jgi:hypothetical protein
METERGMRTIREKSAGSNDAGDDTILNVQIGKIICGKSEEMRNSWILDLWPTAWDENMRDSYSLLVEIITLHAVLV